MRRIRTGNDIRVIVTVINREESVDLVGKRMELYLNSPFGSMPVTDFSVSGNRIIFKLAGKDNNICGSYSVTVKLIEGTEQYLADSAEEWKLVDNTTMTGRTHRLGSIDDVYLNVDIGMLTATDYTPLINKPSINNVKLEGNRTLSELGIQPAGNYATREEIPDISQCVQKEPGKGLSDNNYTNQDKEMLATALREIQKMKSEYAGFAKWFINEAALVQAIPDPKVGEYAWVGEPYPGTIYQCLQRGVWTNTGKKPELPEFPFAVIKEKDSHAATDNNVMTSLRVLKEIAERALSRIHPDEAQSLIRFLKGIESYGPSKFFNTLEVSELCKLLGGVIVDGGIAILKQGAQYGESYAGGLTGFGGRIDGQGHGELRSLKLWEWLEVPELRYNSIKVFVGVDWQCCGAGIVESVTPDVDTQGNELQTGTVKLKLEDGQIGAVDVDDIAMGIYHMNRPDLNETVDSDDGKGNFTFAGFATSYWRITGVSGKRNETFTYALRPGYTIHPQPQMHFACYGNFTNAARQKSAYRTTTYTRYLHQQNTWEITEHNVGMQFGDLSNLSVSGLSMVGYSAYLSNIYMSGTIQKLKKPDGTVIELVNDRGAWVQGHYGYYDRVSHGGRLWLCVAEKGTSAEPSLTSSDWLLQVDKGDAGDSPLSVEILSSRGDKFHNGTLVTTLSATVWEGKKDISDSIPATRYSWTRTSADVDGDKIWNQLHEGIGRYVDLNSEDVYRKAVFECIVRI